MIELENKVPNTISSTQAKIKAMDFDALRQEGMALIRQLSPDLWTDHNVHDPGITILEELCYAITDLAYRLDHSMADLIAHQDPQRDPYASLPPAYDILPCLPVTLMDMRKVILDVPDVKNAWIEKDGNPTPALYYQDKKRWLTFSAKDAIPVKISGLYKIKIQPDPNLIGGGSTKLKEIVRKHWHQCRSLGEDLSSIELIGIQNIAIRAVIEIKTEQQPNALLQKIIKTLSGYISPSPQFHDLDTMLNRGHTKDELFSGPLLRHGFLDEEELKDSEPRKDLRTSDIIRVLMELPEVRLVKQLEIISSGIGHPWFLSIEGGKLPQLDILDSQIELVINGQLVGTDSMSEANSAFLSAKTTHKSIVSLDQRFSKPPKGEYYNLSEYTSIQEHLPIIYGIGIEGLASSEPVERKAAAKQLKAYLLFFEQIIANQHAQLDHFKNLFAYDQLPSSSQSAQLLSESVPGIEHILNPWIKLEGIQQGNEGEIYITQKKYAFKKKEHLVISGAGTLSGGYIVTKVEDDKFVLERNKDEQERLTPFDEPHFKYSDQQLLALIKEMADPAFTSNQRMNRFYDHILARYGESVPDYSRFFATSDAEYLVLNQFSLRQKQQFLKHYQVFSQARNKGFNYLESTKNKENISGLQKRLQLLLGFGGHEKKEVVASFELVLDQIKAYYFIQETVDFSEEKNLQVLFGAMTKFENFSFTKDSHIQISTEGQALVISKKAVIHSTDERRDILEEHWKQCWEWNFEMEGMHLVEHILLRPMIADKNSLDEFFHNYYPIASFDFSEGEAGQETRKLLICHTERNKPVKVGDVIYISGVEENEDIRAVVLHIESEKFEVKLETDIATTVHENGFWYYGDTDIENAAIFMVLHHKISAFEAKSGIIRCTSINHGLQVQALVELQIEDHPSRLVQVIDTTEDSFDIKWEEATMDWENKSGNWQYANARNDPYSLQLSMVLPKWPGRMQNKSFRTLVESVIRDETPAHHNVYVRWLDLDEMRPFEGHHNKWLTYLQKYSL